MYLFWWLVIMDGFLGCFLLVSNHQIWETSSRFYRLSPKYEDLWDWWNETMKTRSLNTDILSPSNLSFGTELMFLLPYQTGVIPNLVFFLILFFNSHCVIILSLTFFWILWKSLGSYLRSWGEREKSEYRSGCSRQLAPGRGRVSGEGCSKGPAITDNPWSLVIGISQSFYWQCMIILWSK